ncbi:hypothetical protein PYCCODRAFT_1463362 [Trametes coccinea BRFM310]|uniref:Uncharacterized protein n=1 Tax=Trametes coccinea (strain BRFM310) TaxID=1353009 RepID=A0A1Y2J450_TRAC3|nr:hypothetical protein PYCCODRAFT_1463362 [Trametes coccinea BRFM310]
MDYIPRPVAGLVQVFLQPDCRYGLGDPIQHPQIFSEGFEYLCAVYRRAPSEHRYAPIWSCPEKERDFSPLQGSAIVSLGFLRKALVSPLRLLVEDMVNRVQRYISRKGPAMHLTWLETAMRHALDRLDTFAATFRDACMQYAQVQRFWLLCRAYMEYQDIVESTHAGQRPVRLNLMGAFTTLPHVVQTLHDAGIPVWLMRPKTSIPSALLPPGLRLGSIRDAHVVDKPPDASSRPLYSGLAGAKHLSATYRSGHTYRDISISPLLALGPQTYPGAISQRDFRRNAVRPTAVPHPEKGTNHPYSRVGRSHIRGRDKFFDIPHPWMPSSLSPWDYAMRTVAEVDRSAAAKESAELWGYWIPEPSLLLNSTTRRERYIMNWLRIRHGWLYLLRSRESKPTEVPAQWWRDFLYGETGRLQAAETQSRNSQRVSLMQKVFGHLFVDKDFDPDGQSPISWFDYSLAEFEPDIAPRVMWELFELGFRYELLALDRLLVPNNAGDVEEVRRDELLCMIFPNRDLYAIQALLERGCGLCASWARGRAVSMEALRKVIVRWPCCPVTIRNSPPLATSWDDGDLELMEKEIVLFYVRTFFRYSGRAPLVPHQYPVS